MITRWLILHTHPMVATILSAGLVLTTGVLWLVALHKFNMRFPGVLYVLALLVIIGGVTGFLTFVWVEGKRAEWNEEKGKSKRGGQEEAPVVWMQINDKHQEQAQLAHSNGPQPDTELRLR